MAQTFYRIEAFTLNVRKKETHWIVFNKLYNDIHAFGKNFTDDTIFKYLSKSDTDYEAQKEFLQFMQDELPNIKLTEVFDLVLPEVMQHPYLGSYAMDIETGSKEYEKLIKKYENNDGTPKKNNAVMWVIKPEVAQAYYEERKEIMASEY